MGLFSFLKNAGAKLFGMEAEKMMQKKAVLDAAAAETLRQQKSVH